jgi:hypothetical protein
LAKKAREKEDDVDSYWHEAETRKKAVSVRLASYDNSPPKTKKYEYAPNLEPQMVLSGKKEHTSFKVQTDFLHIHERIEQEANVQLIKKENPLVALLSKPETSLKVGS